ncbi:hypothetical protein RB195_001712 [Necator americanus]|uniref:Uncharacterized protein n=1 Tax=Necator americanus TaxID=51031 RepID=A0ABR1DIH9_NECAM
MRFNDNRCTRAVSDWVPRDIKRTTEDRRPDVQISSRSSSKKNMMLFVSHAKGGTTGLLWHAIGTNGRITGARLTSSKINGSQVTGNKQLQHKCIQLGEFRFALIFQTLRVGIRSRNSLVSLAELYLKTEKNSDEYDGVPAKFVRPLDHLLQSGWTSNRLNSSMSSVTWAEC